MHLIDSCPVLLSTKFGMWDVGDVRCSDVECLRCGFFVIRYVGDVGCLRCGMFEIRDNGDVECS